MSALAFDTLAFAKALESAGVPRDHAEATSLAVRDHVMRDLASKADIEAALNRQTIRIGGMIVTASGLILAAFAFL